jgi:putative toxin-antitoxin system antitoxin component (TIGR02293 family)
VQSDLSGNGTFHKNLFEALLDAGLSDREILNFSAARSRKKRSIAKYSWCLPDDERRLYRGLRHLPDKALAYRLQKIRRHRKINRASGAGNAEPQGSSADHLFRVVRVMAHAIRVFGENRKAVAWLRSRNAALKDQVPLDLLRNDVGAYAVEEVLHRIEFGIYS